MASRRRSACPPTGPGPGSTTSLAPSLRRGRGCRRTAGSRRCLPGLNRRSVCTSRSVSSPPVPPRRVVVGAAVDRKTLLRASFPVAEVRDLDPLRGPAERRRRRRPGDQPDLEAARAEDQPASGTGTPLQGPLLLGRRQVELGRASRTAARRARRSRRRRRRPPRGRPDDGRRDLPPARARRDLTVRRRRSAAPAGGRSR